MRKKRLHRIIRYRDKALKNIKLLRQKISEKYDRMEIRSKIGMVRKMPPQYSPHK